MTEKFQFEDKLKKNLFIAMGLGLVGLVLAFLLYPQNHHSRFWTNVLVNAYYFTGIGLFGLFFVAANQLGYGGWIALVRRVIMSLSGFIIIGAPILLLIALLTWGGVHNIYDHWLHVVQHPEHISEKMTTKAVYLSLPFWTARIVIYVVLWVLFARLFSKFFDKDITDKRTYKISKLLAAAWIVVFAVSESAVSWDMIMSIDPHWYSTLFGWYNFASYGCAAFAFSILLTIYLKSKGYLAQVNENHIHDLGKFLFGFSVFWTYLWFSQFMLQWYANIPEDTMYWVKRFGTGFKASVFLALAINFLLPLLVLMKRGAKRNFKTISFAAVMIIIGHQIDFCNMVMFEPNAPATEEHGAGHHALNAANGTVLYAENKTAAKEETHAATDAVEAHTTEATEQKQEEAQAESAAHEHGKESHETHHEAAAAHEAHGEHEHGDEAVKSYAGLGLVEILIFIGFAGAFLFMFFNELAKHPLVNEKDPYFQESVKHSI
jgi:F0F1-type ATP synthase membrane subunit c/vacuolar-type H+-ATPase subunit K/branched-subunit amino acid transport protein